jgi:hypothetical protein
VGGWVGGWVRMRVGVCVLKSVLGGCVWAGLKRELG